MVTANNCIDNKSTRKKVISHSASNSCISNSRRISTSKLSQNAQPKSITIADSNASSQNINDPNLVVKLGDISIFIKDINTLNDGQLLNDSIIDFYLKLVSKTIKNCVALSSFWYSKVLKKETWKPNDVKLNNDTKVFIPICFKKHWILIVFDNKFKSVCEYNSLKNLTDKAIISNCIKFINSTFPSLKSINWEIKVQTAPQQQDNNLTDCGVFVCLFARYLANDFEFNFNQDNITDFRLQITEEIRKAELENIGYGNLNKNQ